MKRRRQVCPIKCCRPSDRDTGYNDYALSSRPGTRRTFEVEDTGVIGLVGLCLRKRVA